MNNFNCDLNANIESIAKNKKALIIGCGLSGPNTEYASTLVYNCLFLLSKVKTLEISDFNFNENLVNIFFKSRNLDLYKNALQNIYNSVNVISHVQNTYELYKNDKNIFKSAFFKSLLKEKLKIFSLTDETYNIENYDVFHLRYILHLPEFNNVDRIKIIDKLYEKLNSNGKIYIQNYINIPETINYSDKDISILSQKYKTENYIGYQKDGNDIYTYNTMIITKP